MKRTDRGANAGPCAPSDSLPLPHRSGAADKRLNRRSLEFPQRRIFDAQCVLDKVKKSYSFDQRCDGDIVAKIVEDRFASAISRKVQLADDCDRLNQCVNHPVIVNGEPVSERANALAVNEPPSENPSQESDEKRKRRFGVKLFSGYLNGHDSKLEDKSVNRPRVFNFSRDKSVADVKCGKASLNSVVESSVSDRAQVHLRQKPKDSSGSECARGTRCRSSPPWSAGAPGWAPPWAAERPGGRLCRTWYAGYGTLAEDEDFSNEQTLTDVSSIHFYTIPQCCGPIKSR